MVPPAFRRKRDIIQPTDSTETRPIGGIAIRLLNGVAKARHWLDEILAGTVPDIETILQRENMSGSGRSTLSLAFIAPDFVEAVTNGICRGASAFRASPICPQLGKQRQKLATSGATLMNASNVPPPCSHPSLLSVTESPSNFRTLIDDRKDHCIRGTHRRRVSRMRTRPIVSIRSPHDERHRRTEKKFKGRKPKV